MKYCLTDLETDQFTNNLQGCCKTSIKLPKTAAAVLCTKLQPQYTEVVIVVVGQQQSQPQPQQQQQYCTSSGSSTSASTSASTVVVNRFI